MMFTDLNLDCLYLIFDRLDLVELVNMASITPQYASIAASVFRQKYSDHQLAIRCNKPEMLYQKIPYGISDGSINIYDLKLYQNILKYFGNNLRKINISNGLVLENDLEIANRLTNEYCSKTVRELNLNFLSKNELHQYTTPFSGVEKLICTISSDINGTWTLNQLFPNLQQLEVLLTSDMNISFIDNQLPHLKQLKLGISADSFERKQQIEGMIRKNPQIRSIEIIGLNIGLVKVISEVIPNIENLTIPNVGIHNMNSIQFGSVKNFALYSNDFSSLEKLSFPHLETLKIFPPFHSENLIAFFKRHQHLKRLHLMLCPQTSRVNLEELTADLPNLVELVVQNHDISSQTIIRFIESHDNLMKFQFSKHQIENEVEQTLRRRFEMDWNIRESNSSEEALLFERKIITTV